MAQTLTKILLHVIFSTKDRVPLIPPTCESKFFAYIGGIARNFDSPIIAINGTDNHVHMLIGLSKNHTLSEIMLAIKRDSSAWAKNQSDMPKRFSWQRGYAAFSIGQSQIPAVTKYIANQKKHHQKISFQDELRKFLQKYQLEYDERYAWQ